MRFKALKTDLHRLADRISRLGRPLTGIEWKTQRLKLVLKERVRNKSLPLHKK